MPENPYADGAVTPERIGQVAFLVMVPVFAYLGVLLFDDVLFGGVVGLLVGAGEFLFMPYVLYRGTETDGDLTLVERSHVRRATVGFPLASAGMVALAGRFVVDGFVVPLAVAGTFAAVSYLLMDRFLPDPAGDDAPI